jgi:hypothetical protein
MSLPLSSPSAREECKKEYFIMKSAMPPLETSRRRVRNLNKFRNGILVNDRL